jgi:hypothetical protein
MADKYGFMNPVEYEQWKNTYAVELLMRESARDKRDMHRFLDMLLKDEDRPQLGLI